ncbi:MAG: ATP-binding protein [Actinomycetia bacterium]|nr:ATP-binding protein [Actinomycetes bacterium]
MTDTDERADLAAELDAALTAAPVGGVEARHRHITDVAAWIDDQDPPVRAVLRAMGELLRGAAGEKSETSTRFTARCLGVSTFSNLIDEVRPLEPVARITVALALGEWMDTYAGRAEIGPGEHASPPQWTQTRIGDSIYRHPTCLHVYFPAGTLLPDTGCVIGIESRDTMMRSAEVSAFVRPDQQDRARGVLDRLAERATVLNPYRGRAVRASHKQGLHLTVLDLPATATRANVILPEQVWTEIDIGLTAVRDRHELLNAHGLGARRGVLLCGPPGTGKSAVSAVVAREVVGDFTVIYVEAQAGARLLTEVVEEAQRLSGPVLLVLEDVDLWCRDRNTSSSGGLSELLQAMDIEADARILTLASTNDAATLDKAAIRTGRFDSIVEIRYPDRDAATRILAALIGDIPGNVDTAAVAAALPDATSGSDIREIVRRAVLAGDGSVCTATLLAEVGSGRYRAELPSGGAYL